MAKLANRILELFQKYNIMSSQFLLEQNSIPLPRMLATAIGLEEATVLQQLYYCLQNPKLTGTQANGQKWIRNPIECRDSEKQQRAEEHGKAIDWLSNFPFLSVYKLRRIFAKLENLGLVISLEEAFRDVADREGLKMNQLGSFCLQLGFSAYLEGLNKYWVYKKLTARFPQKGKSEAAKDEEMTD